MGLSARHSAVSTSKTALVMKGFHFDGYLKPWLVLICKFYKHMGLTCPYEVKIGSLKFSHCWGRFSKVGNPSLVMAKSETTEKMAVLAARLVLIRLDMR